MTPLPASPRRVRPANARVRPAALWALALALAAVGEVARAQEPAGFERLRIDLRQELAWVQPFDLDGDGRAELVLIEAERDRSRDVPYTLRVLRGGEQGYVPVESATAALPADVALAQVGHFRDGPGLALLRPGEVLLWPWEGDRFAPGRAVRHPVESLFPVPHGEIKPSPRLLADLNGDGRAEVLVPRFDGLEVLAQEPSGALRRHALLRIRAHARLLEWFRRNLLAYELPALALQQVDGRGWQDAVLFLDGLLWVFLLDEVPGELAAEPALVRDLQPPKPFDPTEPRDPPMRLVEATDLNADGRLDLIVSKNASTDSQFNSKTNVLVYYGRPGADGAPLEMPARPDQAYFSEGFSLPLVLDLDGDRRRDLVLVNVEIGFWNVIKALVTRSVNAEAAFYRMPADGRYPRDPQRQETYEVTFSLGRYSHQPIASFADLNGDGLPDLLLSADKETLGLHWGRPEGIWPGDPDEELVERLPIKGTRLHVQDLNGDGRDDLLLAYDRDDIRQMPEVNGTLTVLLSRYGKPTRQTVLRTPARSTP